MKFRTLRVQPLELRALLAIDVDFDPLTGELSIMGAATDDVVEISANALTVTAQVSDGGPSQTYPFVRAAVRSIAIRGGEGDDQLSNSSDIPVALYGQEGNDTLTGGSGADSIYGADGNDLLRGGNGDDYLAGGAGNDEVYGNSGHDRVHGDGGDNRLRGGDGNDLLFGGDGRDQMFGESGNDSLSGGGARDYLYGGLGNDILRGADGNDVLRGEAGHDRLFGDAGHDSLRGEDGDDELTGDVGDDLLYGGPGADSLDAGSGDDDMYGDDGNDRLDGREGNDLLYGGAGSDDLRGDAGSNELYGDSGDDVLIGGPEADLIWGGLGNDTLRGYGGDDFLYGEADSDELYGDDGVDYLEGGAGDDELSGGDGNDSLLGGDANDLIIGDAGNDYIRGELGNDVINAGAGNDNVNGNEGNDEIFGSDGNDDVMGGPGNDFLRGGGGNDHLQGLNGDDVLYGDAGTDILIGGEGSDGLYGGDGHDLLIGGEHDDRLGGSDGSDLLIGGTTIYDDSVSRLWNVLDAWIGALVSQGLTGALYVSNKSVELRPNETVFDDGAVDQLEGDNGWDSFYWFTEDSLTDRMTDEPVSSGDLSDGGWARRLYLDVLGVLPIEAQVDALRQRLERGETRNAIAQDLLQTNEARAEELRYVYRQTFGSEISGGELTLQLLTWGNGSDLEHLWAKYLALPEFFAAHGSDNATVMQAMFNVVARRTASDDEIGAWIETLAQTSMEEVAYGLITSPEVQMARVSGWYRDYLHRAPTAAQLNSRLQQLENGVTATEVRTAILIGAEYLNHPYFNAAEFGATANDGTDDSAALQMAFDIADLAGNSMIYLGAGTFVAENLRLRGSNLKFIGPGTLRLKDRSAAVGVLTVDGSENVLSYFKIDGNQNGMHTGRGEGLRLVGDYNRVYRVEVANTYQDDGTDPSGQNFVTVGSYNMLIETRSLNAGHSSYRQIGEGTYYRDIVSLNFRVKGFNGSGDGTSFTVDGGYFETNAPQHSLGVCSFQVDPGPGKLLQTAVVRNVTVLGPQNSTGITTAAAKFALVNNVIIENSEFISTAENHSSLRFAEGIGDVILRNVYMSRNLFMQQETHDGSGLDDPMESLLMENCVIGDGVHHPTFAMERVRVGRMTIKDSKFYGYTLAAIDWQSPESEYTRVEVIDTLFRGYNAERVTYDIYPRNGGEFLDASKRYWSGVRRRNGAGGGTAFMP